ncbi:MAG: helicase / ATP-dependent helicase PcrA [Candidatus Peribacteria bacterium]|nr:helicase / ATP-dependent helicase PcrA [Candidatus Peribacteria bacterium]
MPTFDESFQKLNPAQRQAVETIEGPVMVVAGPGTGKTQVLGMRVANILQRTQMRPSNILCLTFSNSGATAMRERLRLLIGPDAYGVKVATIHGFCNDIIRDHPHVFEEWSAREQISDLERYREVNAIIDTLMPNLALVSRKHPYSRTRDILGRMSQFKREGKANTEELKQIADAYEQQLASMSKEGTKAHEKNLLTARKFRELTVIFAAYQAMLNRTSRYDYDDMILHVISALQAEDWMLASLQERYQYVLVDEFQDTNGSQYEFIKLLTTYPLPDVAPNLFVVGDDDQAIYRFQGANLQNLLSFHARFPAAPVIALTTSYRSTQSILDTARNVIGFNAERLVGRIEGLEKNLTAVSGEPGVPPHMLVAASNVAEPWMIADVIEDRLAAGIPPDEIAVLTQTNGELRTHYDVLRARNIPVQMVGKVDLLTHPLVQQLLAIVKAVYKPDDNVILANALAVEFFGCHPADLGHIFHMRRERDMTLMALLMTLDNGTDIYEIHFHNMKALLAARNCILSLHQRIGSRTVVETIERVLKDCGLIRAISGKKKTENDGALQQNLFIEEAGEKTFGEAVDPLDFAAIQAFFNHVLTRAHEQPHYTFTQLMHDLAFYEQPDYGDLRLQYVVPQLTAAGVRLMTAHQSKGLEFHTVILAGFREGQWDKRRNPPSIGVPEDLLFGWQKEQKSYEQGQDERRVAFVAMTRAKKELIFTCPREIIDGDKVRAVSPSAFFAEAGSLEESVRELKDPHLASTLLVVPRRVLSEEYKAFLRSRLENFHLSVSSLNRFLEDPLLFVEIDLLQMPQTNSPEFMYGNAVHEAIRRWGLSVQEQKPLGREAFVHAFEMHLQKNEIVTDAIRAALVAEGKESLPRYYDMRLAGQQPFIYKVESSIRARLTDSASPLEPGIPLKGKIDRIDIDAPESSKAKVIDFKTGAPKTESQIRDSNVYRQLTFYSLLIEIGNPFIQPYAFVLDFVGGGAEHPIERIFQIPAEDREELKKLIRTVWAKIMVLDFTPL